MKNNLEILEDRHPSLMTHVDERATQLTFAEVMELMTLAREEENPLNLTEVDSNTKARY